MGGDDFEKKPLPDCLKELHEKQQAKLAKSKENYTPPKYNTPRKTTRERLNRRAQIKAALQRKKDKLKAE
uniref:60S large subunit ribosomal protein Egr2 n=1 Tax=Euglena gracilis TaxID=3039 RepID=A0A7L5NY31_EUGGR|nr:60S large subunit ribosomal protein Egr2 [Euglena gracilis]6ZJ3_L6 Chain L6, Ribosomal protein eLEgr2 [Euglena gracilis]